MKKFLRPLLMLVVILAACIILNPTRAQAASTSGLTFTLDENGASFSVMPITDTISGELTIPASYMGKPVTTIGDYAFANCTSLTSVTIPDSVTTIGDAAFAGCDKLTKISVAANNPNYRNDSYGVLFNKDKTTLIQAPGAISGAYTIPDSVTTIGKWAFGSCDALTSVTIGNSVTTIGDFAFTSCGALTSVTIPDSVTTIGNNAFSSCSSLTSVTIPDSVTTIGDAAFAYCDKLTKISVAANNPNYRNDSYGVLFNKDKTTLIQAPGAISGAYTIPDSVTTIGNSAFNCCFSLTSVTIPDSVTTIGNSAFNYCSKLADVYYTGTQEQWDAIQIGSNNTKLKNATRHYIDACTAYGHTEEILPGKAASGCYETGLTEGLKCSVCNEVFIAQEVIPAPHTDIVIIPGYPATCTQNGWTDGKGCDACGELVQEQEFIPAIGHIEEILPAKAETCTEHGFTEGKKCANCAKVFVAQEVIPATGHSENIIPGYPATCTEAGLTDGKTCSVCGEVLAAQETIPALGHSYDDYYDPDCNACGAIREVGTFKFENYRVIFSDNDESRKNWRVEVYKLGDQTVADPTDEKALKAIDANPATYWGASHINKICITDAGNYVLLLKYNVGTEAATKVPMEISVSAAPKLIIDKNNKITAVETNEANINHRVVVYYLGDQTVEDIYDVAALEAIDSEPETIWKLKYINCLALTKGGNYVLHLCYNEGVSAKITVAQQFTVFSIPSVSVNINNKLVAVEENPENRNHRATVFFLGEGTVEDPFDEAEVKAAAVSSKTYWGIPSINKAEMTAGGNYVIHLYYNVGTSEKRTLALAVTINERPALSVDASGKINVSYTDPEINNARAYIYNVGDAEIDDIYDEAALKAIATPTQVWGKSSINKKTLTPGTYVIHFYYSVGTSAKKTVALKVTV